MDLHGIRQAIDALDREIVALIARRQELVEAAGALKKDADAVRAPDRVEQVIARVRSAAMDAGADPDVVEATFRAMIDAFISLEMRHVPPQGVDP